MADDKYHPYKHFFGWNLTPFYPPNNSSGMEGPIHWNFRTETKSSGDIETVLCFKPSQRDLKEFVGNWLIKGVVVFCEKPHSTVFLEVNFTCNQANPVYIFDSTPILGRNVWVSFSYTELVGMGVLPKPNYIVPNEMTDVCLVVEQQRLHLSKTVLAHHSDYFKAMFFGSFSESVKDEIEIKDVKRCSFIALLDLCFGAHLITAWSVNELLEYADRFSMPSVRQKIESYILVTDLPGLIDNICLFTLADQYKLSLLMSRVVSNFTLAEYKKLMQSSAVHNLSPESMVAIMKRGELLYRK